MGLSGTIDSAVYEGLRDVLQRYPVVATVAYQPDSIVKKSLRARIDPARVVPPTGPEQPRVDVEWRFGRNEQFYRIHYADPNTGFNCGWHRDEDHPELGPVHFQYEIPGTDQSQHEPASFEKDAPTEILWSALDRLFETQIIELMSER
ncbi:hypothetical protein QA600_11325 [Natronococcus sp. A-GB1]|uniref:hypothetical protein n=1 Tax=Natronococcus sp. A-GB1 TaxID=3037648 RepID=UPI00242046DA|nr:hypothetical protein [Natronococcus sp. A-GB1]MDG5759930.1 hypothetical protein [Natronococcus sp. A-GB1]